LWKSVDSDRNLSNLLKSFEGLKTRMDNLPSIALVDTVTMAPLTDIAQDVGAIRNKMMIAS
jgi:hypothetical protein